MTGVERKFGTKARGAKARRGISEPLLIQVIASYRRFVRCRTITGFGSARRRRWLRDTPVLPPSWPKGAPPNASLLFQRQDGHTSLDDVGLELASLAEARQLAIVHSGEILRDGASDGLWAGKPWPMW